MNAIVQRRTSFEPSTLGEAMQLATMLAKSTMVPRDFQNKPENVMVAIAWGREVGLGPLQALNNIAVINGRPTIWGDAAIALVKGSPDCQDIVERITGEGDAMVATCEVRRRGKEPVVTRFDVADAKKAGLWGKAGPWQQYPKRMLQMRARGFALRDAFPDVLKGVITAEEARDIPADTFTGPTIEVTPAPRQTTAQAIEDDIPDYDGPEYPFATTKGGNIYRSGPEWVARWTKLIADCVHIGATDKLVAARDLNEAQFGVIEEFDPQAVQDVNDALDRALESEPETA